MHRQEQPRRSILIVDDTLEDCEHLKTELAKLEINPLIFVAHNGVEAIEFLTDPNKQLPDVILLDPEIPKMDGYEFLKVIRSYHSFLKIRVYVMRSLESEYLSPQTEKLDISGYLTKPLDLFGELVTSETGITNLKKDLGL